MTVCFTSCEISHIFGHLQNQLRQSDRLMWLFNQIRKFTNWNQGLIWQWMISISQSYKEKGLRWIYIRLEGGGGLEHFLYTSKRAISCFRVGEGWFVHILAEECIPYVLISNVMASRPSQLGELSRSEFNPKLFSHSTYDKFLCDIRDKSVVFNICDNMRQFLI